MRKLHEILTVVIFSLVMVLAAAVGFRAYEIYRADRQLVEEQMEQERVLTRNREANDRVLEMRQEIQELSGNREELSRFLEEIQAPQAEEIIPVSMMTDVQEGMTGSLPASEVTFMSGDMTDLSGNTTSMSENAVSAPENSNDIQQNMTSMSDNMTSISGDTMTLSENAAALSGNGIVSANMPSFSENDIISMNTPGFSGNGIVSANELSVSENEAISGNMLDLLPRMVFPEISLEERREIRSSYMETLLINEEDLAFLAGQETDFSEKTIVCMGDSITAAANLEGQSDYPACSYPSVLRKLLGAKEVVNLGIGGSAIGRYWSDPFVERYREIPQDADIIIVMGGTNDGFCLSEEEMGTLTERKPRTFCGDLDELMRGLKEDYPEAEIWFVTPLPNILQDYLMRERSYLLPQSSLVNVMLTLAAEYGFPVIDLYNANLLDSHDTDIVADYMPDGVHANEAGYRILAQHIAAEILRRRE